MNFSKRIFLKITFYVLLCSVLPLQAKADEFGILIGPSEFDYTEVRDASSPEFENNIRNIKEAWIAGGMSKLNIRVVTGKNATKQGIEDAFKELGPQMGPDDTLNIVWTGHTGDKTNAFLARDGYIKEKNFLRNQIKNLRVKNIDIFLDVCRACTIDTGNIPGKSITILGSIGPKDPAKPFILEKPGKPAEVKGIGSHFFAEANTPAEPGDIYARADQNKDDKVDLWEAQNYMANQEPITAWDDDLRRNVSWKQIPCIKEHRSKRERWMEQINHARITFSLDMTAGFDRPDLLAHATHSSRITFDCELERKDYALGSPPSKDVIPYRSKKCTVDFMISDNDEHVYKLSPPFSLITITHATTGSGGFTQAVSFDDFVELDIYPELGTYKFTAYSHSGPTKTVYVDKDGSSTGFSTAQFNFCPTYYFDMYKQSIHDSDSWTMTKYLDMLSEEYVSTREVALAASASEKDKLEISMQYPYVPTVGTSPQLVMREDPFAHGTGTISAEWVFEGTDSPPSEPSKKEDTLPKKKQKQEKPQKKPQKEPEKEAQKELKEELEKKPPIKPEEPSKPPMIEEPTPPPQEPTQPKEPLIGGFPRTDITAFADQIVEYYKNGNYTALYNSMAQETKADMSLEGFVTICESQKQILGELRRYNRAGEYPDPSNPEIVAVEYYAEFSRADGAITVAIVAKPGNLSVKAFIVNSSSLITNVQNLMSQVSQNKQ